MKRAVLFLVLSLFWIVPIFGMDFEYEALPKNEGVSQVMKRHSVPMDAIYPVLAFSNISGNLRRIPDGTVVVLPMNYAPTAQEVEYSRQILATDYASHARVSELRLAKLVDFKLSASDKTVAKLQKKVTELQTEVNDKNMQVLKWVGEAHAYEDRLNVAKDFYNNELAQLREKLSAANAKLKGKGFFTSNRTYLLAPLVLFGIFLFLCGLGVWVWFKNHVQFPKKLSEVYAGREFAYELHHIDLVSNEYVARYKCPGCHENNLMAKNISRHQREKHAGERISVVQTA